jgi:hypothetical protein
VEFLQDGVDECALDLGDGAGLGQPVDGAEPVEQRALPVVPDTRGGEGETTALGGLVHR